MSQPADNRSAPPHNRWQFSLGGLFIFTLSVAIGAAVMQEKVRDLLASSSIEKLFNEGLCGGLLIILAFWMILGILYQVRDLHSTLVSHHDLCSEHIWGLRFEIFWRLIVAVLMSFGILMTLFINQKIIVLSIPDEPSYMLNGFIPYSVPPMFFLVVVGSAPYVRRKESSSLWHRGLYLIFCVLAGALCLGIWAGYTIIYYLVAVQKQLPLFG